MLIQRIQPQSNHLPEFQYRWNDFAQDWYHGKFGKVDGISVFRKRPEDLQEYYPEYKLAMKHAQHRKGSFRNSAIKQVAFSTTVGDLDHLEALKKQRLEWIGGELPPPNFYAEDIVSDINDDNEQDEPVIDYPDLSALGSEQSILHPLLCQATPISDSNKLFSVLQPTLPVSTAAVSNKVNIIVSPAQMSAQPTTSAHPTEKYRVPCKFCGELYCDGRGNGLEYCFLNNSKKRKCAICKRTYCNGKQQRELCVNRKLIQKGIFSLQPRDRKDCPVSVDEYGTLKKIFDEFQSVSNVNTA